MLVELPPGVTLRLSLRSDGSLPARQGMLDLLLEAFRQNSTVVITFDARPNTGRTIVGVHVVR